MGTANELSCCLRVWSWCRYWFRCCQIASAIQIEMRFLSAQWMTNFCLETRLLDFCIGCCLGYLYLLHRAQQEISRWCYCIMDGIVCAATVLSWYIYTNKIPPFGSESMRYSLLFISTTVPLIWLTVSGRGIISTVLSTILLRLIGDISPFAFLIHTVVIMYIRIVSGDLELLSTWSISFCSAAVTLCMTMVWMKLEQHILKRSRCKR